MAVRANRIISLLTIAFLTACGLHNPTPDVLYEVGKSGDSPATQAAGSAGTALGVISIFGGIANIVKKNHEKKRKVNWVKYARCLSKINEGKDDDESLVLTSEEIEDVVDGKKLKSENDKQREDLNKCMDKIKIDDTYILS